MMEDDKDRDAVLVDNPEWVTIEAAEAFSRSIALSIAAFFLTLPRAQQDGPRLLGILRDLLVQIEEDHEFASERTRRDVRVMRRCLEETLKSQSVKLLVPSEGPPH